MKHAMTFYNAGFTCNCLYWQAGHPVLVLRSQEEDYAQALTHSQAAPIITHVAHLIPGNALAAAQTNMQTRQVAVNTSQSAQKARYEMMHPCKQRHEPGNATAGAYFSMHACSF